MATHYSEGLYKVAVVDQAWQRAKTGAKMLVFQVEPIAQVAEDGRETPVSTSYTRTIRLVVKNEKQAEMVLKKLRHAGWEGGKWSDVDLVGQAVVAECTHGEYNNEPKEDWDLALPGRGPLQSVDEVSDELDSEFPLTGATAIAASPAEPADDDDDDIPFVALLPVLLPLAAMALGVAG